MTCGFYAHENLRKATAIRAKNVVSTRVRAKSGGSLTREAQAAEQLRLGGQRAGQQEQPLEQLLFAVEGDPQQAGLERNSVGEIPRRRWIREDDLDSAGGGFGLEFDDAADDPLVPAPFDPTAGCAVICSSQATRSRCSRASSRLTRTTPMRCIRLTAWRFFSPKRASMSRRRKKGMV